MTFKTHQKVPVRKAVFPVAGFGTRFLPATKAMPKELLPILDKPLIQYAAEEAIAAGIDTLIFVTGKNKRAIEDHFDANHELEAALISKNDFEKANMVRNILPSGVECIFVRQPEQRGLGDAILCAERAVGNEPFAVLLADDYLVGEKPGAMSELISGYNRTGLTQLSVMDVEKNDVSKYGVVRFGPGNQDIIGLVEKPTLQNSPSTLASIGRYVLTSDIFEILKGIPLGIAGELQLTDGINIQAKNGGAEIVKLKQIRFDCGSLRGYANACLHAFKEYGFND